MQQFTCACFLHRHLNILNTYPNCDWILAVIHWLTTKIVILSPSRFKPLQIRHQNEYKKIFIHVVDFLACFFFFCFAFQYWSACPLPFCDLSTGVWPCISHQISCALSIRSSHTCQPRKKIPTTTSMKTRYIRLVGVCNDFITIYI